MLNRKNSLFAILSRQPWWVSVLIAAGLFASARLFLPDIMAVFSALPFILMAGWISFRQLRTPSPARVAEKLDALRALSAEAFGAALAEGLHRSGHEVGPAQGGADYALRSKGHLTLLACRRWKAAQTGIGPLKELVEAAQRLDAQHCVYVAVGEITETAHKYAVQHGIRFILGPELVKLAVPVASGKQP